MQGIRVGGPQPGGKHRGLVRGAPDLKPRCSSGGVQANDVLSSLDEE